MPELSIIVTSYNIEPYIERCLDDISKQSIKDIEIIVVDDGSTDKSPEIIRAFAQTDPRVLPVLLEKNSIGGVAIPANIGIEKATGDYIGFADGDDLYDPQMFEKLVSAAKRHHADLVMCNFDLLDAGTGEQAPPSDKRRWEGYPEGSEKAIDLTPENCREVLAFNSVPWRKIYHSKLLKEQGIRFPEGDYFYEDNPFHWFNVLSANRIVLINETLCSHRMNRVGQTMMTIDHRLLKMFDHHATINTWLNETGKTDQFGEDLLIWVTRQMRWMSAKCPENLRADFFTAFQGAALRHTDAQVASPYVVKALGRKSKSLIQYSRAGETDKFWATIIEAQSRAQSPKPPQKKKLFQEEKPKFTFAAPISSWKARKKFKKMKRSQSARIQDVALMVAILDARMSRIEDHLTRLVQDKE